MTTKKTELLATYWLENLTPHASRFSNKIGKFELEPNGYVGSIVEVERKVAFDPYVKRAIAGGKLRQITEREAVDRMEDLQIRPSRDAQANDNITRYLGEQDERASSTRYKVDLPEVGSERTVATAEQVWQGAPVPSQHAQHTTRLASDPVTKSSSSDPALGPDGPIIDKPILDPSKVLTEPVKEGEWAVEVAPTHR